MNELKSDEAGSGLPEGQSQPISDNEINVPTPVDDNEKPTTVTTTDSTGQTSVLQVFTDRALHFLAHASNETLGACLAGLGASTYFIFGRVGLVIIGVAGGVVLHATWEGIRGDDRDEHTKRLEQQRKKETGLELARRLLDLRVSAETAEDEREEAKLNATHQIDFSRFEPETAAALDTFVKAVIRDYVHYWYDPQIPGEETFPAACKHTLVAFILSLSGHLERKRPADALLDIITNTSSLIIVFLNELATAVNASPSVPVDEAIATYLHLKPDSSLAHVLDKRQQDHRLDMVAEDILKAYLDPKAFDFQPTHAFLKQVLSKLVLGSTITLCSAPEWINEWIVYGLEASETTKSVMDIVDAGVDGRDDTRQPQSNPNRNTQPNADHVTSKREPVHKDQEKLKEHKRDFSRSEGAMDEAMKEARRLTQLMIEEDRLRAQQDAHQLSTLSSSGDFSDAATTHGAPTPTSSDSDRDRQDTEVSAWADSTTYDAAEAAERNPGPTTPASQPFLSFDQLVPNQQPTALSPDGAGTPRRDSHPAPQVPQLTLHNATISLFDDSVPGEKATMKSKPTVDYMIQVEPSNSSSPGWMIARKYPDFEVLHEVLRRISVITGSKFTDANSELPRWRGNTKPLLREQLERYLQAAMRFQSLAESEGMKRFLEKEQALSKSPGERSKFAWPTPDAFGKLGGNMIDVLAKAPKDVAGGVAGGGKAFFGGMAGLVGGKKTNSLQASPGRSSTGRLSTTTPPTGLYRSDSNMAQSTSSESSWAHTSATRESHESLSSFPASALERKESSATLESTSRHDDDNASPRPSDVELTSRPPEPIPGQFSPPTPPAEPTAVIDEAFVLPPPPSDIPDDYGAPSQIARLSTETRRSKIDPEVEATASPSPAKPAAKPEKKRKAPLTEQETAVAVELMCKSFANVSSHHNANHHHSRRRERALHFELCMAVPSHPPCCCKNISSPPRQPATREHPRNATGVHSRQQPLRRGYCKPHIQASRERSAH
jgi:hypothetical protein